MCSVLKRRACWRVLPLPTSGEVGPTLDTSKQFSETSGCDRPAEGSTGKKNKIGARNLPELESQFVEDEVGMA
jgi:hypothetical protein